MSDEKNPSKIDIDRYKLGIQKIWAGLVIMTISGVVAPIVGFLYFDDLRTFGAIALITVPITIVCAVKGVIATKDYFKVKKELDETSGKDA